ncbi:hypothetical protein TSOC_000115 [Tetrabaena socialis]|uniref:Uncharacterized protein n=1 Tax=Tetrabaena socialis TaxID=47790 RepID=A0A2J8AK83_9CHLO|nr:hypothetical protein TSOC_000115 [Tetrabaena socialis]|eukprot:PNH12920.1 hypothetical protein TSOC_000115 [Tetrabaena socialis]
MTLAPPPMVAATYTATSPQLYNNITLFTPLEATSVYIKRTFKQTTRTQLAQKLAMKGLEFVVRVDKEPPSLLRLIDFKDTAADIDLVELQDGMQLVVPVAEGMQPLGPLCQTFDTRRAAGRDGTRFAARPHEADDELKCFEWATARVAGNDGGSRFCFKALAGIVQGVTIRIEIDGLAHSPKRVVLVGRRPRISYEYVEELAKKRWWLGKLVEAGAPNTDVLRDPATGHIKPLETALMADGWADDAEEQAACVVRMQELGIMPVLPRGGSYSVGDSCHPWPPQLDDRDRLMAQRFLCNKATRQQPTGGASSAAGGGTDEPHGCGAALQHRSMPPCTPASWQQQQGYAASGSPAGSGSARTSSSQRLAGGLSAQLAAPELGRRIDEVMVPSTYRLQVMGGGDSGSAAAARWRWRWRGGDGGGAVATAAPWRRQRGGDGGAAADFAAEEAAAAA